MKKESIMKALGLAVAAVLTGFVAMASAQDDTNSVYSANVVGVIRKTIPPGKMILMSIPLDDMESTNSLIRVSDLPFLASLPVNSQINVWDAQSAKPSWKYVTKGRGNKWDAAITNLFVRPGQPIFCKNGGSSDVMVSILGEVPEDASINVNLAVAGALECCANPYPVAFKFVDSTLAQAAKTGAQVNFWDTDSGGWVYGSKGRGGKWDASVTNVVVEPGEGFMFKSASTETMSFWTVNKPYEWPEN